MYQKKCFSSKGELLQVSKVASDFKTATPVTFNVSKRHGHFIISNALTPHNFRIGYFVQNFIIYMN